MSGRLEHGDRRLCAVLVLCYAGGWRRGVPAGQEGENMTTEKEDQVAAVLHDALAAIADGGEPMSEFGIVTWDESPLSGYIAGFTYRGVAFSLTVHETE